MADFFWCKMAAQRGWSAEETARKLVEISQKAQEKARLRDEGYALIKPRMLLLQPNEANSGAGAEHGPTLYSRSRLFRSDT